MTDLRQALDELLTRYDELTEDWHHHAATELRAVLEANPLEGIGTYTGAYTCTWDNTPKEDAGSLGPALDGVIAEMASVGYDGDLSRQPQHVQDAVKREARQVLTLAISRLLGAL